MAIARLTIDLEANLARFEAGMKEASASVERAAARMNRSFAGVGSVFAGSALASAAEQAARSLASVLPELVGSVAAFQDLEEVTGASAVSLAALQTPADVAGLGIERLAGFMVKLTGTLSKTDDETKGAGAALKALGIEMAAFKSLAPEQQFEQLGKALNSFADGPQKTAVAIALLGKSGAEALPFLKQLGETGASQIKLTKEQIALADDLADRNAALRSELKQAAQLVALQALPAFNAFLAALSDTARETLGLDNAQRDLAGNNGVETWARNAMRVLAGVGDAAQGITGTFQVVGTTLGALGAQAAAVLEGEFDRARSIAAEAKADIARILAAPSFSSRLESQFSLQDQRAALPGPSPLDRGGRQLNFRGGPDPDAAKAQAAADRLRKAQLDAALASLRAIFEDERDLVQFQQRFLQGEFDAGLVHIEDYYARRRELARAAVDAQVAGFAAEAAALKASLAETRDPAERERTATKIAELQAKEVKAAREYRQQQQLDAQAEQQARQRAVDQTIELRARTLELNGDLAEAARLRTELVIAQARRGAAASGIDPQSLSSFEAAQRNATELQILSDQSSRVSGQMAAAEERLAIAMDQRAATTVEREQAIYQQRSAQLAQLQALRDRVAALANAADPNSPAAQFVERLDADIQRLAANIDPALQRMRAFTDDLATAGGDFLTKLVGNPKDAKAALKAFEADLLSIMNREFITRPVTDWLKQALNGLATDSGGGIGQFLQSIFGTQGGNAAAAAVANQGGQAIASQAATSAVTSAASTAATDAAAGTALATAISGAGTAFAGAVTGAGTAFGGAVGGAGTAFAGAATGAGTGVAGALTGAGVTTAGSITGAGAAFAATITAAAATAAASLTTGAAVGAAFSSGGYTGPGATHDVAGVVHAGEYVFSAPAVRNLGVTWLEEQHQKARRGAPRQTGVYGYANGGLVGAGMMSTPMRSSGMQQRPQQQAWSAQRGRPVYYSPTFVMQSAPDRRTQQQIAAQAGRGMQRALARAG
ncbi:MAG: hypothetical protein ACRCYZ_06855 [Alphaproteobacteria bacterium]